VAAVDYLLKPFDRKRFDEAIERVKHHVPRDLRSAFFTVRKRDRTLFVPIKDVDWIAAEGKYVRIHTGEHAYLVRDAIATVEERLRERQFVRIHRGTIVNLRRVAEVRDGSTVVLRDGTELAISRRFRTRWQQATSNW
jgi:two-component system LytT family response regulator